MMADQVPRVVIIGGGFGGLNAAQALDRAPVRVTLIDRRNHHLFQPLLYQVATAALNPSDIASPIRRILRHQKNVEVLLAEARRSTPAARAIVLDDGALAYDYLIVATGATHSYFGHDEWARFAPGSEDASTTRWRSADGSSCLRGGRARARPGASSRLADLRDRRRRADGGRAGGRALAEIAQHALARDFRQIDPTQAHVILLEGSPRVLPAVRPRAVGEGPAAARRASGSRSARGRSSRRSTPTGWTSATSGSRPGRCSGRRG